MTIEEKLKTGYYLDFKCQFPIYGVLEKKYLESIRDYVGTREQLINKENEMKLLAKEEYYKLLKKYHDAESIKNEEFHKDLMEEFGTKNNQKEALLFSKAWQCGHSDGLCSVYDWYSDLVELIK
jgi:hypothetical protein